MIIHLLASIILIILIWVIITHKSNKEEKIQFYTGVSKTTYPDTRPNFNVWMRYIRLKNYQSNFR